MTETYDWSSFYDALCQHGPNLLLGIDDELREMIAELGSAKLRIHSFLGSRWAT